MYKPEFNSKGGVLESMLGAICDHAQSGGEKDVDCVAIQHDDCEQCVFHSVNNMLDFVLETLENELDTTR